jgi:hypothetical protein
MSEGSIDAYSLAWEITRDIIIGLWVLVAAMWIWLEERRYIKLIPSRRGADDLRRIVDDLAKIQFRLRYNSPMMANIRRELFKVECKIMLEANSFLAIHATNVEQRRSALLFLSQAEGEDAMKIAEDTISAVLNDRTVLDIERKIAKVALDELKKRKEIIKKTSES